MRSLGKATSKARKQAALITFAAVALATLTFWDAYEGHRSVAIAGLSVLALALYLALEWVIGSRHEADEEIHPKKKGVGLS